MGEKNELNKEFEEDLRRFERGEEKLNEARKNCEYMKIVPSIPAVYPKCEHPEKITGVCAYPEDCPKLIDKLENQEYWEARRKLARKGVHGELKSLRG